MKQKPKVLRQLLAQKAKKTSLLVPLLCSSIIVGCSDGGDDGMNWGGSKGPNLSNPSSSSSVMSSSSSSSQTQESRSFTGAAVDGPIAHAVARVYRLDTSAANLQGTLLVEGETDAQARFSGLEVDADETGPFLIVVTAVEGTIDLNTGLPPIISEVRTVVTADRIERPVYATPLTSMAVSLAAKKSADAGGSTSEDFTQGLEDAASEVVSALGFGMDDEVDIFTASPIVNEDTDSDEKLKEVAKYRTAISGVAAVIYEVQKNSNDRLGDSSSVSANTIMEDFAKDLSDGAIDGKVGDDETIENYSGDDASVIVETDPAKLVIPGTDKTVEQTEALLDEEKDDVGSGAVDTSKLADGSVSTTAAPAEADIDRDKDGVINSRDAFPNDPNESVDTDGDGVGNNADPDDDNDGARDELDAFPLNPSEKLDTDQDGIGNNADDDDDGDGVVDSEDDFPLDPEYSDASDLDGDGWPAGQDANDDDAEVPGFAFVDTDGDGVGNTTDTDDDNDGVPDVDDDLPLDSTEASDTDGDGIGDGKDDDIDGDGVANHNNGDDQINTPETRVLAGGDAFPFNGSESSDLDRDGIGDNADSDADGDGLLDINDPDPTKWDTDGDGVKDGKDALPEDPEETLDSDRDGIGNNADNCQFTSNFNQLDSDQDGLGNACDDDDDGDGVLDAEDDFPLDPNASSATDADNDGWPLGQDPDDNDNSVPDMDYVDTDGDGLADEGGLAPDSDDDNDGYNDEVDAFPTNPGEFEDADQDGIGNNEDTDDDNDQVPDVQDRFPFNSEESLDTDLDGIGDNSDSCPAVAGPQTDTDQDGKGDVCDSDDDNDGVEDANDRFPLNPSESKDTDGDGTGNNADTDDDGDGLSDEQEIALGSNPLKRDSDADGIDDADDNCLLTSNADQTDSDSDGVGDACDQPITVGGYYLLQTEVVESTKAPAELDVEAIDAYECESELGDKDSEIAYIKHDGEGSIRLFFADDDFGGEGELAALSAQGEVTINTSEQGGPDEADWSSSLSFAGTVAAATGVIAGELEESFTLTNDNQELVADCLTRSTITFTPMAEADAAALLGPNSGFVGTYADVEYEDSRYREWLYEYEVLNTDAVSLYVWNGMEWMLDIEEPQDLVLTSLGWEWAADSISVAQAQGNTAVVQDMTVAGNAYANWNVELFSIDAEGQIMANLLGEDWGENALLDPSATFASGAQAIALRASNDSDIYEIYCDDYDWANTGLNCINFVEVPADEAGNFAYASTFDQVVHSDTATIESRQQGVVIGRDDSSDREIVAYLQTDADSLAEGTQGTVRFYLAGYDGGLGTLLNDGGQALTSSWEIVDPLDDDTHVLLEFDVPAYVLEEFDYWHDSEKLFLTVLADENSSEDVLRVGNKTPAGTVNMETGINLTALQDVLANFNTEMATPEGDNLVRNGGFEAADGEYQGWFGETHMETEASFSITDEDAYSGARSLKVDVTTTGDFEWTIQGGSRFMRVTPGDSYTVMAWVKASREDTKVVLQPTKRSYPFTPYGWYEEQVGTEWTRIIGEVYVPEDSTGELRLVLNFSFPENDGASFYVDDIQLWGNTADAPVNSGQNLAINGGLEASDTVAAQWANYAQDGAVEMSVTTQEAHSGSNALMLQLGDALLDKNAMVAMPGMHLVQGTQYVASAWVKGAAGTELELGVINSESSPLGFSDELRMTGDWQLAQFMVDASWETSSIAGLFVFADKAGNEGATFYIDDVQLHGEFGGDVWPEGSPLIMNTGFEGEDGLMGWTVDTLDTDVSITLTNTGGKDSDYAVSVTTPTGLQDGMVSLISDSVTTQGNADHVVTAWIKGTADSVVDVYLNNAAGERIGASYPRALTGEWQQIFFRVWLAEEVTQASVGLTVVEADAAAEILIDEVQLWGPYDGGTGSGSGVFNSDFEEGTALEGWVTTGDNVAFALTSEDAYWGANSMRVDVVEPGAEAWLTQTGPEPFMLTPGHGYDVIVRVKGPEGSTAALTAVENQSWAYFGSTGGIAMNGDWMDLWLSVNVPTHSSGDVQFTVDFGFAENANTTFYVDAFEYFENGNMDLLSGFNPGLEWSADAHDYWNVNGADTVYEIDTTEAHSGAHSLKATIGTTTANSWDIGPVMYGVSVTPGNSYEFSGWVKGPEGTQAQLIGQGGGDPYPTYGASGPTTLTGEWQHIVVQMDIPVDGLSQVNLAWHLSYEGNAGAVMYFDDLALWGNTYSDTGTDSDGDGFAEQDDNCVNIYNPEQLDDDNDGYGNVCDNDIDGDGVDNELDADPYDASVGMFDKDGDGFADQDDNCLIIANPEQLDDDDDGLGNACDVDVAGPSGAYLAERTYSSDNLVYNEDTGACEADTSTLHLILETHMVGNQLFLKVRGDDEEDVLSGVVNSDGSFSMLSTPEFTGDGIYYPGNNAFALNFEDFTGSEDGSVSCYAQGTVIANAPAQVAEKPAFDAGLTWIEGYSEDGWMEVETGSLVTGEAEVIELWDNSSMMWQVESGAGERGLLTDSGAMMVSDLHSVTGFNDGDETAIVGPTVDGSVVTELSKHVELEAFPVTGLPLAPFLDETLAELIGDAVFSSGAVAYLAHVQTAIDHIEFWCDDDYDAWFEGNLLCDNIVSVDWVESTTEPGVYEPAPATSVDDVVATPSDFPSDNSYLLGGGIWIGEGWSDNGGYQIMAYMVSTDGTVQDAGLKVAFFQQFENGTIHHLSDEPVDVSSVGGIDVYALNTPDHVDALIEDGRDGIPVVFAESSIEGTSMVRTGELMQAGPTETVFLFNTTATSDIRGNIPTN